MTIRNYAVKCSNTIPAREASPASIQVDLFARHQPAAQESGRQGTEQQIVEERCRLGSIEATSAALRVHTVT